MSVDVSVYKKTGIYTRLKPTQRSFGGQNN